MPRGAYIVLDTAALQHNTRKVREYAPQAKLVAVIKANAYGHGLVSIAQALVGRVEAFAVARLDEALILRAAGISEKILVLQGCVQSQDVLAFQEHQLDMLVHSEYQVCWLEENHCFTGDVWLKVDTGMHRVGITPEDFPEILLRLKRCQSLGSIKLMTHFANADNLSDAMTEQQWQLFLSTIQGEQAERSAANSAAIVAWPDTQGDRGRAGLMLYGASPIMGKAAKDVGLLPVMHFYAQIIALKTLRAGESVGYAGAWTANKESRVAVVSAGYGDGYPRHIKPRTSVLIQGQHCTIIGRVSMDMLSVDVSQLATANVGDRVTLWGKGLPVDQVAEQANTIAYTLLCAITQRVQVHTLSVKN